MVTIPKNLVQILSGTLFLAALTACGGSSSSSETTIPNSVTIFYAHNLVFKNNTTFSTGYNGFGQLGAGDLKSRNTLGAIKGNYRFKGFAMGGVHSVAFINNSTVMSWGYNGFGQLGNNSTTYSAKPVPVANIRGVKALAAGAYHNLALRSDDTLWSWGSNSHGQLGVDKALTKDTNNSSYEPTRVNAAGVIFSNISSIAANAYHSLARANGNVWAWGFNDTGQLGIDPTITGALASPSLVAGLPTGGIDGIASGGAFNYALARNGGTVWAWGNNDNGQLGNDSVVTSYTPVQVKKKNADGTISPLTGVIQVAAGIQHGLALHSDGTVWAWGYNAFWQLGNVTNQASSNLDSPVAVQVLADAAGAPLKDVTEIRAFGSSSMARIGKDWYVWGDNAFGQLGIGANSRIPLPEKMSGF
jgi:alpha-tubulin suppressor-like RCC1 family protein